MRCGCYIVPHNLAEQADVVAQSALHRTESRGAHIRDDFTERDDVNWLNHSVAWRDGDAKVTLGERPVRLTPLFPDTPSIPPGKRII